MVQIVWLLWKMQSLTQYTSDGFAQALLAVIDAENPEGIILGHTSQGKDLAPRIAGKLQSGLISDVTSLEEVAVM